MKENNVVMEKAMAFAIRVVNLYKLLCDRREYVLSKQLLRSGTAIGALLKESEHAQSRADFVSKLSIALKEANESDYWIELLYKTDYLSEKEFRSMIKDCEDLLKLLASIVKTIRLSK